MPPEFPQELIEYTIDFLHDDNQSLKACSLTCRAWINASRYHLFHSIIILLDVRRLSPVFNLLQTIWSNPTVASYITKLFLKLPTAIKPPGVSGTPIETQDIITLISSLPRVSELTCAGEIETFIYYVQGPIISTVTNLNVGPASYLGMKKLTSFISSFSNLERLSFPRQYSVLNFDPHTTYPAISPKLHWLRLSMGGLSSFKSIVHWIMPFVSQLRYFELFINAKHKSISIMMDSVFSALGSNITHLHLYLSGWDSNSLVFPGGLKNLQELELTLIMLDSSRHSMNDWANQALESIHSSKLTKGKFGFWLNSLNSIEDCLTKFNWARFEESLCRAQFSKLSTIELVVGLSTVAISAEGSAERFLDKPVPISDMLRSRLALLNSTKSLKVIINDSVNVSPYYQVF